MSGIKGANAGEKHGNYTHGCTNTKLFRLWEHMRERCYYAVSAHLPTIVPAERSEE